VVSFAQRAWRVDGKPAADVRQWARAGG
jgi:hypothetical protein